MDEGTANEIESNLLAAGEAVRNYEMALAELERLDQSPLESEFKN